MNILDGTRPDRSFGRSGTTSNCRRPPHSAAPSFGRPVARLQQRSLQSLAAPPVPLLGWAQAKRLIHSRMAIQTKQRFHTELQQRIVPFSLFAPFVERVIKAGRPLSRSVAILISRVYRSAVGLRNYTYLQKRQSKDTSSRALGHTKASVAQYLGWQQCTDEVIE